jgi:hypothetical protein
VRAVTASPAPAGASPEARALAAQAAAHFTRALLLLAPLLPGALSGAPRAVHTVPRAAAHVVQGEVARLHQNLGAPRVLGTDWAAPLSAPAAPRRVRWVRAARQPPEPKMGAVRRAPSDTIIAGVPPLTRT